MPNPLTQNVLNPANAALSKATGNSNTLKTTPNNGSQMNDTWENKFNSQGTATDGTSTTNPENANGNVQYNDVVKNKKLAEITMAEQLRETYNLTITIPKLLKGLHTNQFLFMDVNEDFYEKNYPDIIKAISNRKFARFAGFKKGRFFIDKVVEKGGTNGWSMEITVNPIPSSLAVYSRMQQEATKALIDAINNESGGGGSGGGLVNASGKECGEDVSSWTPHSHDDAALEENSKIIIGNSGSNYAQETASMSAEQAIKSINHSYSYYENNRTCPAELWQNYPNISCNCADWARLVKCICDVHGQQCAIYHAPSHYFNFVKLNGKWESIDLCTNNNDTWRGTGVLRNTAGWQ